MKLLAVDFGMKRIGFAIGNTLAGTASPIEPLNRKNSKQVLQHIAALVSEYDISQILMGYPLHMDGTATYITTQVEHFTRRLKKAMEPDIPVQYVDERLSSFEAQEELKSMTLSPGKKHKQYIDSMSAVILLRRFMESPQPPKELEPTDNGDH